jgi:hypothetical protein
LLTRRCLRESREKFDNALRAKCSGDVKESRVARFVEWPPTRSDTLVNDCSQEFSQTLLESVRVGRLCSPAWPNAALYIYYDA